MHLPGGVRDTTYDFHSNMLPLSMIRSASLKVMADCLPKVPIDLSMRENPEELEYCNDSASNDLFGESNTLRFVLYNVISFECVGSGQGLTFPESSITQSMV